MGKLVRDMPASFMRADSTPFRVSSLPELSGAMNGLATNSTSDLFDDDAAETAARRVRVLLPLPLAGPYDYLDLGLDVQPGDIVTVPLGRRESVGVVWDNAKSLDPESQVSADRLKPILSRHTVPPLAEPLRRHIDWVADYTVSAPGAVLKMALSVPSALEPPKPSFVYLLDDDFQGQESSALRMTPARRRALDVAARPPALSLKDLAREAGVGTGVIKKLLEEGALRAEPVAPRYSGQAPDWRLTGPVLSSEQIRAADTLRQRVGEHKFSATLLDGVTGSGKTEVYFEAIAATLAEGRQVLVMLPEIALSTQWLDRFTKRFGAPPAEWHSDLAQRARRQTWRGVAEGHISVVVGARSALFLPFPDLGLIIVDEEHESAFKQEDGVTYHARDMAVVRASLSDIPIVLASATPSLESVNNVALGKYHALQLTARHGGAEMPALQLVDLRADRPAKGRWLSSTLTTALLETLDAGDQAMLYLNRRGYAPLTLCRGCGHRLECPNCTAWLVEHRLLGRLQCHHCGYQSRLPTACPECGEIDSFAACGPGVERLHEEVLALFSELQRPAPRIAVMTSDTVHGPAAAAEMVRSVRDHEIDLVIGTQIMAKGHHFPMLTLVGVVDADLGLSGGDLRASERTYQVLQQVAGRAGREGRPGRAVLQTADPDHRVLQALISGDRDAFLAEESDDRKLAHMPPFGRLVAIVVSAPDPNEADEVAQTMARIAPRVQGFSVLGPAPAPLSVLRGRHRRRLLVKASRALAVQRLIREWLQALNATGTVRGRTRVQIDVDPYSFL